MVDRLLAVVLCTACLGCDAAPTPVDVPPSDASVLDRPDAGELPGVRLRLLAINDLHGHLRPPPGAPVVLPDNTETTIGGVAFLATTVTQLRAASRNSLFVSAGDLIGGSPLISGLFHDEPTVEAMSAMGLDYNGVGNHEFDEGLAELRRMQSGGCHPVDGCYGVTPFAGARFRFLAANVVDTSTRTTVFPRYDVREFEGVRVAVVGMTLQGTPGVVPASGVAGLEFANEAATVNALVPELRGMGVEAIVVLLHQGGTVAPTSPLDACDQLAGPLAQIADMLDDEVDVIVSAHTHAAYVCRLDGKLVTSAGSFGRLVTALDLRLDPTTGEVLGASARNVPVLGNVTPDPAVAAIVARYEGLVAERERRVIGTVTAPLTRAPSPGGTSTLGCVVTDAQLAATRGAGAVVAFQQNGGLRADVAFERSGAETADGQVTFGEGFQVHPFGNVLWTATLTGAQIESILEGQFAAGRSVLQVSRGFAYAWDSTQPVGSRVDPASVRVDGQPLDLAASYRVTFNEALAASVPAFAAGTDVAIGPVDLDAFEAHLRAGSPLSPPPLDRVTRLP